MNPYYYARLARRDFGDLLSEEGASRLNIETSVEADFPEPSNPNEILAVWSSDLEKTAQLPVALICQDGTQDDWAAWITTFAPRIRPFSAYMRLMTSTDFRRTSKRAPVPSIGELAWPQVGLVLGEVLMVSGLPDKSLETLPVTACMSTLSFVMSRTAAIYADFEEWPDLVAMWKSVREITKQSDRSVESALIARACATIMDASGFRGASKILTRNDMEVCEVCRRLIRSPQGIPNFLAGNKLFARAEAMMHGSREDRVLAFEDFVRKSDGISVHGQEVMSFMLGYLASRIAPGTIRHSSVLAPIVHRYPTSMLWYGFCSGFGEADPDMRHARRRGGLDLPLSARRVFRELLRPEPLLSVPGCDIGYLELLALSRTGGNPLESLVRMTQGSVTVEFLPGVCTSVNVSPKPAEDSQVREFLQRDTITTMGQQIDRLSDTHRKLMALVTRGTKVEQPSMFPSGRKKK